MNFVFAIAITLVPLALLLVGSWMLSNWILNKADLEDQDRAKYKQGTKNAFVGVSLLILILSVYSAGQSYGPRNTLMPSPRSYYPEVQEIQRGKAFTEKKEWRGTFDDKLENEKP
jgi:hypothetical protein